MYVKISGVEGRLLYLQRTVTDNFHLTLSFLLFLTEKLTRRYGHPADPPVENDNSIAMQPIESSPRISRVPDVLPLSNSNHAYEDIEPQEGGQTATSQLQRQNAVDMPATQQPFHHHPRLRSLTDTSKPPPVPSTRRPSQCDTTVQNTRRFRSLSEESPVQVAGFTNTRPLVFNSGRDDPPTLVPRVRRPSNGSLSESRSDFPSMIPMSGQEKDFLSNITPISETSEDFITENNEDDTDVDGYMKCVRSRDGSQTVVQV